MLTVPKILWQSYKSIDRLPVESLSHIDSWVRLNRSWAYHFCSDSDIERFFQIYRGGNYLNLLRSMPLAVMKVDLWRYAVLEEFGGFYADIDTICRSPMDDWFDRGVGLHVGIEHEHTDFSQWAFGGIAHHPVFRIVLDLIRGRVEDDGGVDETRNHYVHHYTGPSVWSAALKQYLQVDGPPGAIQENKIQLRGKNIRLYPPSYFYGIKINHIAASFQWRNVLDYESWQIARKDLTNRVF